MAAILAPAGHRLDSGHAAEDLQYLFVVTYGRSGSTLLMGVFQHTLPGYLVRGENRDALHHLFLFDQTMRTESNGARSCNLRQPTHPFFGIAGYPREKAVRAAAAAGDRDGAASAGGQFQVTGSRRSAGTP